MYGYGFRWQGNDGGVAPFFTVAPMYYKWGHGKPAIQAYACHLSALWAELSFDWLLVGVLCCSDFNFTLGLMITDIGFECWGIMP